MTATETIAPAPELSRPALEAWKSFLFAHSHLIRELDAELREQHDFTLGDFDVLAQLSEASGGSLRMCELAAAVVLSPSGLSRRVDRLERAGLVERRRSASDARSIEARLTATGKQLFRRLRKTHLGGIEEHFADRFNAEELETLRELLARLDGAT